MRCKSDCKGFGWAEVEQLSQPLGPGAAMAWLVAALLVMASAGLMAVQAPNWWILTALGALVSQAVIVTSRTDAKAGTAANVVMLVAAGHGWFTRARASDDQAERRARPAPCR
jgi:hypothetical protein